MPYKNKADKLKHNKEYSANLKRIPLDIQKKDFQKYKDHADSRGESMNGFIKRSMRETMQRDLAAPEAPEAPSDQPEGAPTDGDPE